MNWENFKEDPLYSQILTYWYDEWDTISEVVKEGRIGIDIINIRIVLLDIINEYELNQFESENNRKVYIKLIETLCKKTYIGMFKEELLLLKENLEKREKRSVYIISKDLFKIISERSFAYILFDELGSIIERKNFEKKDRLKVKELTKEIIVDLITSGVDIEYVKKMLPECFESYFENEIYEVIPEEIVTDKEKKEYIDNLNIKKRLDFFKKKLLLSENEYVFIYPIWGIRIHSVEEDDLIFGCKLYNPNIKKVFKENTNVDETFDKSILGEKNKKKNPKCELKYLSECNAEVLVTANSLYSAKKKSELKFSNLLNFLNLYDANEFKEFFWDGQFFGKKIGEEFSLSSITSTLKSKQRRRNISKSSPLYLSKEKYHNAKDVSQIIEELEKKGMYYESKTILNVIDIMSKAQWKTEENKILSYWIALESLANISKRDNQDKIPFIKEIISNIYFFLEQYQPIYYLSRLTFSYSTSLFKKDNTINIPEEFLKNTGIYHYYSEDNKIPIINFYNRIEELKKYTTKEIFLDEIKDTLRFYENNTKALKRLRKKRREVKLTIDYIYKCRNQIVHNGYVDRNLIPYLVSFTEEYANALFDEILNAYKDREFNLQNYFIKNIYEGSLIEKKLSNKKSHYNIKFGQEIII